MTTRERETLHIELLSYWHAGTGKGEGSGADALVARTPGGLPYLPGRTLYGLLREAVALAEAAGQIGKGRTDALFGTRSQATGEEPGEGGLGRFADEDRPTLELTSAFLARDWPESPEALAWEAWAANPDHAGALAELTPRLAATAVDERGLARRRSLRSVEVAVPLDLYAEISAPPELGDWRADLGKALPLLRAVGSRRSRGFGRCRVTFLDEKGGDR
ncbi:MAG: RAMP superfamily CRISPR-associated protein [Acidobacteriota bacterium]|jgi:hypothetical protein|nr:RAMP superfamily CRISPR-associated protein [Acidobacteriota bacterium]